MKKIFIIVTIITALLSSGGSSFSNEMPLKPLQIITFMSSKPMSSREDVIVVSNMAQEWLKNHPNVVVINQSTAHSPSVFTLTLLYHER